MADHKGDGAGLSATDLSELADAFQTITDIFLRLATEEAKKQKAAAAKGHEVGAGKGNG